MMMQRFWILLIGILQIFVLEFDVSKADPPQPPSNVSLISIDTSTLRLQWSPPITTNATNATLTGFQIRWNANVTFVISSVTAFNITNLQIPGKNYTAAISAYYVDQRNSDYISASNNTYPSPPYNLNVTDRGTNWLSISFDKQGVWDSCDVWAENATGSFGSCSPGINTADIDNLPVAGKEYTIHIVAKSGSLTSSDATTKQSTNLSGLQLTATPLQDGVLLLSSVLINWTLSADLTPTPDTYYYLTITDTRNTTFQIYRNLSDLFSNNRSVVISGLDEYWNYSASISAKVMSGNNELVTNGVVYFETLQSTPGLVSSFGVSSLSYEQQCNAAKVTWDAPFERDLNGIITQYVIRWFQVNGSHDGIIKVPADQREAIVHVEPDDQQYDFMIQAVTIEGEGETSILIFHSTGSCLPVPVQNVSSILKKPDSGNEQSTTNSFSVDYDLDFFLANDNGEIILGGLIVREVTDNENLTNMAETGDQSLFNAILTWSEAIKYERIPEYRATPDNWLSDLKNVTRNKRSSSPQYTVGANCSCSKSNSAACNGPLPPCRSYQARAAVCTRPGCYKTEYASAIFTTKCDSKSACESKSPKGWIAAAVIVPIVCIVAVVLILLYIKRKQKQEEEEDTRQSAVKWSNNSYKSHTRSKSPEAQYANKSYE